MGGAAADGAAAESEARGCEVTERLIATVMLVVMAYPVLKWLFGHYRLHITWDEVFGWSWWISDERER